ncbi:MAG TPA: T9SS type A sorting domain-containing protein, partial [Rhodothermales bacterium]|nr:T9SS type A sorting domain-containing protein [Rhodothermales bacterium]
GARWDLPWANYVPQITAYPNPATCTTIPDPVTTNTTLTTGSCYRLFGFTDVNAGVTLTIQPGVVIFGDRDTKGSLIINRDARINAVGTAAQPIVFTSALAPGARAGGDWGGIIIAGRAPLNVTGGEAILEGGTNTTYGGGASPNAADDSGRMEYVRIEFPGIAFATNNEINCLTTGAVGSATIFDYIQCSYSGDDSFEPFGGTHNMRHFISFRALDDDLDGDNGWNGNVQWFLAVRDPALADISGSNGIEHDNNAGGTTVTPRTAPVMSNVTMLGPDTQPGTVNVNYARGAHIRRSSQDALYNSVIVGWPTALRIDGATTVADAQSGALTIRYSLFSGTYSSDQAGFDVQAWFTGLPGNQALANSAAAGFTQVVVAAEPAPPPALAGFALSVAPNPVVGPSATLALEVPSAQHVRLAVFDALGREVAVVADQDIPAGARTFSLDTGLAAGSYVVRLQTPNGVLARRFTVAR